MHGKFVVNRVSAYPRNEWKWVNLTGVNKNLQPQGNYSVPRANKQNDQRKITLNKRKCKFKYLQTKNMS